MELRPLEHGADHRERSLELAVGQAVDVAVPEVGSARPSSMRSVVVLPAPFGPRKPSTRPGSALKLSPSTARFVP